MAHHHPTVLALAATACFATGLVHAQDTWPARTVTIIVPAAPGGTTDIVTRLLADGLSREWGQSVVVDNRAGAAGIIGTQQLVRSAPDGYTLIMGNIGPNAINYSLYKKLPYRPTDFAPVTLAVSVPNVLVVNADSGITSARQLIDKLKAEPAKHAFGSSGKGQSPHLSGEMFIQRTATRAEHVAYKGAGPAVAALLANQFTFMVDNLPSSIAQVQGGKFRALALTGSARSPQLPDVPTMAEAGVPDMVVTAWFGLVAPAGTPPAVVHKIQQSARKVLLAPENAQRLRAMGAEPGGNTPEEFGRFIDAERQRWKQTVEAAGLSMDE
jgi:tripartite-type tricarboxylate transporter receptor subunit TctC